MSTSIQRAERLFKANGGLIRTRDAIKAGVHPRTLYEMRDAGLVEQADRGIFRFAGLPPLSNPDLALTAKRVPSAVVCLISALAFHELTTQIPHTVQIALRPGSWTPKIEHPPIEVAFWITMGNRETSFFHIRHFGRKKSADSLFIRICGRKWRQKMVRDTGIRSCIESLRMEVANLAGCQNSCPA